MLEFIRDAPPVVTVSEKTTETEAAKPTASSRLLSLDVFRGLTIAAMVLVNNAGNYAYVYPPLKHAEWHGWTPTDLIFPFFIFIVGVAIPLALQKRVEQGGTQHDLYWKIVRRSLLIFFISLILLHGFPYTLEKFSNIRIPGVLQRIAICYFFAAFLFLKTTVRTQAIIAGALLFLYWAAMMLIPVPGFGAGDLSMAGSLASWIDRTLLPGHIYRPMYDPEGIFSTIPALSTCLAGVLTGRWLQQKRDPLDKVAGMFGIGALCIVVGYVWDWVFPINKPLWTSSYVVFTAGMALQLLALCMWAIDIKDYKRWAKPFVIFGVNALALYVFSGLLARILSVIPTTKLDGTPGDLKTWMYEHLFATWLSPINASLGFAIAYVLLWLGLMTILYRRKIFIKV
jgi:predicted acyltransferase